MSAPCRPCWAGTASDGPGTGDRSSAEASHDVRTHAVRNRKRQSLPQRDERAVLRVCRIVLGNSVAVVEAVFVMQRLRLEAPVLLECERSGSALAAAVVEDVQATLTGTAHELPILEI